MKTTEWKILVSESIGAISCKTTEPSDAFAVIALAHGAGAGMNHSFMDALANELCRRSIAVVRYNFPYMENGKKRPDMPAIATKAIAAVLAKTQAEFRELPLFAAGKSFGGRMTSQLISKEGPGPVKGIIFYGFPLHAAGDPSIGRAEHLAGIAVPMLFLQGTRDALAELDLLIPVTAKLPSATVVPYEGADHSFKAGKRNLVPELAEATSVWIKKVIIK